MGIEPATSMLVVKQDQTVLEQEVYDADAEGQDLRVAGWFTCVL